MLSPLRDLGRDNHKFLGLTPKAIRFRRYATTRKTQLQKVRDAIPSLETHMFFCQHQIRSRQSGVTQRRRRRDRFARRGQSLVEFAVVALVVYMLLAAILTFGHALYVAQGLQTAADLGAREISRTPLPAEMTFEDAIKNDVVRERVFDEAWLVVNLTEFYQNFDPPNGEQTSVFRHLVPQMPPLNQQLATLMIVEERDVNGDGTVERVLRYPGALLPADPEISPPGTLEYPNWVVPTLSVQIPLVSRTDGVETGLKFIPVVEEIKPSDSDSPFSLSSDSRGVVALRINYPFQSASMSSFSHDEEHSEFPFEPTIGRPNVANEAESVAPGTYAGANGLGVQLALGQRVRPYRRVISAQAIYRREIFE